jgi:hypothetical protein
MSNTHTPAAGEEDSAVDVDPTHAIDRYIAGSDSERDRIEADHPALITEEIRQRATQTREGSERTWTTVGARYTTPARRPDILHAIASLQWHEVGDRKSVEVPAVPGLAINACIRAMRMRHVSQLAWHGVDATVDWYEEDPEGQHYAIYGIQAHYANGRARLYVIDIGTDTVPLASDFWPAPVERPAEVAE